MSGTGPPPPVAPRRPVRVAVHGDERVDEWAWLRDRDDPEVIAHLEAENAYTRHVLAPTEGLQQELYDEMVARILETDLSVPARKGEWWYYARTVQGLQYPIACRKKGGPDGPEGPEEVMLDENVLASGHAYFEVANLAVSPDAALLAYATDSNGSERYTLRIRDLASGQDLADEVVDTYYGLAWAGAGRFVFYTKVDDAMRPHQLWRHAVGSPPSDDVLVYQEDDERFFLSVQLTKSEQYLLLNLESKVTTEVHFLAAAEPDGEFAVVEPRRQGVEYQVDHHGDRFLIVTNAEGAENF
ncbi:MAG: oligopeptidase B, partial [Actinomycetota bacterium]|nr:oligopeptidase B [Actinomycetota bacterium]